MDFFFRNSVKYESAFWVPNEIKLFKTNFYFFKKIMYIALYEKQNFITADLQG